MHFIKKKNTHTYDPKFQSTRLKGFLKELLFPHWDIFNPPTPMSDQDRISPYSINTISARQVMRIKKNINTLKGFKHYIPVNIGLNKINCHSMTEA